MFGPIEKLDLLMHLIFSPILTTRSIGNKDDDELWKHVCRERDFYNKNKYVSWRIARTEAVPMQPNIDTPHRSAGRISSAASVDDALSTRNMHVRRTRATKGARLIFYLCFCCTLHSSSDCRYNR